MLQQYHNCLLLFSVLCCIIYTCIYSGMLFMFTILCMYHPVLTCFIPSCLMIGTEFFALYICIVYYPDQQHQNSTYVCMYACMI